MGKTPITRSIDVLAMLAESFVWALALLVIGQVFVSATCSTWGVVVGLQGNIGVGFTEELVFRAGLLSGVHAVLRLARLSMPAADVLAIVGSSVAFSWAHCNAGMAESTFRFLAGCLFGALFVCRGFGVAASTHAIYDILVTSLRELP